jgi:tetratricopeptide (TPR) repeat protein
MIREIGELLQVAILNKIADHLFMSGEYEKSLKYYQKLLNSNRSDWAMRQIDWIRYKLGEVSNGWPFYPGTYFDLIAESANAFHWSDRTTIKKANKPYELAYGLKLKQWHEGIYPERSLLIWFNFDNSIGGELFNLKIIKAFNKIFKLNLVLAVDPRIKTICEYNFPGISVVNKTDDLRNFSNDCSHFMLSRDALGAVVKAVDDFSKVAKYKILVPQISEKINKNKTYTHRFAISWKTTNKKQAGYRNVSVKKFAKALANFKGIEFYSVQHGVNQDEVNIFDHYLPGRVNFDSISTDGDVAKFASQLSMLDGVITIDNTVLHVAGAIGLPTVGMISIPSYWMWPVIGSDSRWYPSVRLLHQNKAGCWDEPINQLGQYIQLILMGAWSHGDQFENRGSKLYG